MDDLTRPAYIVREDGLRLAYRLTPGNGPTLVFLPGYASDMQGSKASALESWAVREGYPFLRFDYAGCGESGGAFEDQTLETWLGDALFLVRSLITGPVLLVGSSMGGWIMLHVALALGAQAVGLVGIAAAPDFTDWGFSDEARNMIEINGRIEMPNPYGPEPSVTTLAFLRSGSKLRLLDKEINITVPVRLIQGQADGDVPWETALCIAEQLRSSDVQINFIKDGDHRLSREQDISMLIGVVSALMEIV
jgi:pimeloyl-ACP methyl ester carboxylesterase